METSTPFNISLIFNCRKGDRQSQRRLYELLAPQMYNLVLRRSGNAKEAERMLIKGFITIFNSLNTYSPKGDFINWAENIFLDTASHMKKERSRKSLSSLSSLLLSNRNAMKDCVTAL